MGRGLRLCTPSKLPGGRCGSCGSVAHTAFSQVLTPTQPLSVVTSLFLTTGNARMFCSALPFVSKCKEPQNESKNKDATLIYRVRDKGMRALHSVIEVSGSVLPITLKWPGLLKEFSPGRGARESSGVDGRSCTRQMGMATSAFPRGARALGGPCHIQQAAIRPDLSGREHLLDRSSSPDAAPVEPSADLHCPRCRTGASGDP